jgi:two-component system nitrogen regulation response regulator GlnG
MNRILIIDDEPAIGWSLRELLTDEGHAVEVASSAEAALETCGRFAPEAMLLDVRLPGRDGLTALPDLRAAAPGAAIVVMTAFGDLDTAVRAVAAGAFDYLVKPFDLASVSRVVSRALADRGESVPAPVADASPARLVGSSAAMQAVFKQIAVAAATDLPVLITGQTGTGKELAARAIHAHSRRRDRPLVATSLAALAPSVVESELFGHVRGAFTGATADRRGLFEQADGGTLLLDEIGEAPLEVQAKLLRVLEDRAITPVGASAARPVDVRVIAATNRDLVAALEAGRFRIDLYHRLRVFQIEMPPLATRPEDLPALVDHFLAAAGHGGRQASAAFLAAVRGRSWPGNVRELRHAVELAAAMARGGSLEAEHLPPAATTPPRGASAPLDADECVTAAVRQWVDAAWIASADAGDLHDRLVKLVEKTLASEAVGRAGGNRTAAAKALGLDRATLRAKLQG